MNEQEHEIRKLLAVHDAKFLMMMDEIRDMREEMRHQQARQDEERRKHDADMKILKETSDDKFQETNQRFYEKIDAVNRDLTNQIHSNFVQTMIGFGAIAAAVGGIVIAAFK